MGMSWTRDRQLIHQNTENLPFLFPSIWVLVRPTSSEVCRKLQGSDWRSVKNSYPHLFSIGHPDVEQPCKSSVRTWSPNSAVNPHTVPPACPEPQGCYLELEFHYPLVPESLTVWVTFVSTDWDSTGAVNDIKLLTTTGKNISLGPQNVFCDVPLTIKLRDVGEEVYGIQIYTLDEHLEIDAAMLTSIADSPLCLACKPLQYKVVRDPPLQVDVASVLHLNRRFTDM